MKKIFSIFAIASLLPAFSVQAQTAYIDEVKALGYVAGQGLACGAAKLDTFEMLARAIIITKAISNKNQADGMYAYNEAKADSYFSKQMDGFYGCTDIARRFDRQDIFKATLYGDGSIKMPDGRMFTPRQPYDATILSIKNDKAREEAQKVYDQGGNVTVGEITINTDGSSGPIKTKAPGVSKKINQPKPAAALKAPSAVAKPAAVPSPKVNDTAGIRHIKK